MKRPVIVTITGLVVLIFSVFNAVRMWTSIAWSGLLAEFSARLTPGASALIGAFWTIIGLVLLWGIWRKTKWSAAMLPGVTACYTIWYWYERFIFQNPRPNILFGVIVNLTLFVIIFLARRSLTREAHERDIENPASE